MDKRLILTVGLPRSGKSTWAKEQDFPIVSPDAIRLALHGEAYKPDEEGLVWWVAKKMVKALFLAGHGTVIVDATHVTEERRSYWADKDWCIKYYIIAPDLDLCLQRATFTNFPLDVVQKMYENWEPVYPTLEAGSCLCKDWMADNAQ